MGLLETIALWGIPTATTGFFFWLLQRKITKQDNERKRIEEIKEHKMAEREKHREKLLWTILQSNRAVTVLSKATARAVQRIPEAHCNGDMTKALEFVNEIQNEQKDFMMELGIHSIYEYD